MTFISLVIVFACAAFALYYAFKTAKNILAASTGNEDMQRIAGAIQEGAQAYLKRQYRTIAIVGVVVALLLLFTLSFLTALGFVLGAVLSGLAGFIGIWSGFFAALAQFQVRQMTALHEPEWRIVFYFSLVGTIAALVGHFAYEGQLTPITSTNIWALLGIAVSGVLAQLSLTRAWGGGNLLLTSSLQFSAIVFAAIIGFFVFDEPISVFSGLGIALIVGSGLTATLETKRKLRTSIPQKSSVKSSTKG